jgi:hypothetical protein
VKLKRCAQKEIQPQHTIQLTQARVTPRDAQLKGKPSMAYTTTSSNKEEASKGCATSVRESNHIKRLNQTQNLRMNKRPPRAKAQLSNYLVQSTML